MCLEYIYKGEELASFLSTLPDEIIVFKVAVRLRDGSCFSLCQPHGASMQYKKGEQTDNPLVEMIEGDFPARGQFYKSGFHCFLLRSAAREWKAGCYSASESSCSVVILDCKGKKTDIVAAGMQHVPDIGQGIVLVFSKLTFPKEIVQC